MTSSVGSSISSQKGWPAATSCATSDGEGSRTISPASSIQLRMVTSPPDKAAGGKGSLAIVHRALTTVYLYGRVASTVIYVKEWL